MSLKNIIPPKKMQTGGQTFQSFIAKQYESQNLRGTPLINQPPFVKPVDDNPERTINLPSPIQPIDPVDTITPEQQLKKLQDDISIPDDDDINTIYDPNVYGDSSQPVGIAISNIENISKAEANALSSNTQSALLSRMSPAVVDALATPNKEPFGTVNQLLSKFSNVVGKTVLTSPPLAIGTLLAKGAEKIGFQTEEEKEKSSLQRTDPAYFGGPIYQRQQAQANKNYVETVSFRDSNNRTVPQSLLNSLNTGEIGNTDYAYALEAHKQDITNVPGYYEGLMATGGEEAKNALGYALGYTFDEGGRYSTTPDGRGGLHAPLDQSFSSRDHAKAGVSNKDIINLIHDGKTARGASKETVGKLSYYSEIEKFGTKTGGRDDIEISKTFDNVTPEEARDIIDNAIKDGATESELELAINSNIPANTLGQVTGKSGQQFNLDMSQKTFIDEKGKEQPVAPDVDASPKVICAELYRQGLLEKEIFELDEEFGRHLRKVNPDIINGYHQWALPLVFLMQRSIVASHIIKIIARPVVKHIAYQMGYPSKTYLGHAMFTVGKYICRYKAKKDIVHA